LVIGAANGEISGTPTVVGTCDFSACVEDDDAEADCQGFSVTIDPPAPAVLNITTTSPLSDCVQHQACSTTFEATGGTPPYTWTKASGTYCVGNSSLSGATLSGAPTTVETCTFTMQVEDDDSATDTQEFERTITSTSATLLMQAIPGSNGVILKFGTAAMNGSQECDITINDEEINPDTLQPYGVVATGLSSSGRSTRVVALGGLAEEHQHTAIIVCGTVASGSVGFLTSEAVGGTISWQYTAVPSAGLQARSAAKLTVEAVPANGGSTVTATNASCGSGCTVTLGLESGDVYTIRHIWKTAGDSVLATTSYAPIVVP
jgi:Fe-S cluster assembly iron-binding protein IscA